MGACQGEEGAAANICDVMNLRNRKKSRRVHLSERFGASIAERAGHRCSFPPSLARTLRTVGCGRRTPLALRQPNNERHTAMTTVSGKEICVREAARQAESASMYVSQLIDATPTSELRNKLTDANIHLLAAMTALQDVTTMIRHKVNAP